MSTSATISGLHHVTAITADAQKNIDFYCGVLGLRLVKLTVNFDDPSSYHLYYGDEIGRPGTILLSLSGHGLFDMAAYQSYLDGEMRDVTIPDELIERSLAQLPRQPEPTVAARP